MDKILFVYGSLLSKGANHHLLKNAEFLGKAETKEKYALYLSNYPCVIKNEKVSTIKGELYRINMELLKELDIFEGHPHEYCREKINAVTENKEEINCFIYFYPFPEGLLLSSGSIY